MLQRQPFLSSALVASALAVALLVVAPLSAQSAPAELATVDATPNFLTFQPLVDFGEVKVTVSGPSGFEVIRTFTADEALSVELPARDGLFKYELRFSPVLDDAALRALEKARQNGTPAPKLGLGNRSMWGSFTVAGGSVVSPTLEPRPDRSAQALEKAQIISPDGVVYNSLCVGFDCPASPSFGSDTIRMQENNLRINADDTSSVGSYPSTDWRLEFNSDQNGGGSYFRVIDSSASRDIMTLEGGAPSHSLYVENSGEVGIGTTNPVVELHAVDGDSPGLRLEQDTSSGFAAQTWDLVSNETSFFIRDATNGSTLPFRIRPGASSNALVISNNDNVGIGTLSPGGDGLEIVRSASTAQRILLRLKNNGAPQSEMENSNSGITWRFGQNGSGDFVLNDTADLGTAEFRVETDGDVFVNGSLVHSSSRTLKENFQRLNPRRVLSQVAELPVSVWNFKADSDKARHVGPVAEDFFRMFGFGVDDKHIADGDQAGIALLAIQGLNQKLQEENEALEARIAALEKLLADR